MPPKCAHANSAMFVCAHLVALHRSVCNSTDMPAALLRLFVGVVAVVWFTSERSCVLSS